MRNFGNGGKSGSAFRKLDPMNDNDAEDGVMMGQGAQCDSDSDFDPKDKNARTKISRVGGGAASAQQEVLLLLVVMLQVRVNGQSRVGG